MLVLLATLIALVGLMWFGLRAGERRADTSPEHPQAFVLVPWRFIPFFVLALIAVIAAWR